MVSKLLHIAIIVTVMFSSCKKSDNEPAKMYYTYFPTELGMWVEYQAEHISYDNSLGTDTTRYFLKEVVAEEFVDNEGRVTFRIERFTKEEMAGEYEISDVWYSNLLGTTAERVEENRRFTKLIFPISEIKSWDGNAFNSLPAWDYEYDSLHIEREYNGLVFDSTIKVMQIDNVNPFQNQVAYEIYGNYVGLIRKSYINVDNGDGESLELTIIDYGR